MANSYKDLIVWQRAVQLSLAIYRLTDGFPTREIYGLSSQMRQAGVSVPSNIAEGWGRQTEGDYRRFLSISRGSNMELQTQLIIARELGFGDEGLRRRAEDFSHEVGKMLVALIKSL